MRQRSIHRDERRGGAGRSAEANDTGGKSIGKRFDVGEPKRRSGDQERAHGEPPPLRLGRPFQRLREPPDADRAALHAPGLRPGSGIALGGDAGHAHRYRRLPLPDDGDPGSRAGPCARPRRRQAAGQAGFARAAGDPDSLHRPCRAVPPRDRRARSRSDPALLLRLGPVRLLRCAVDAGVPLRALHVPLDAGGAGSVLGLPAAPARADQPGADRAAAGRARRGDGAVGPFRRADAGGQRDGPRPRHGRGGGGAVVRAEGRVPGTRDGGVRPERLLRGDDEDAAPVPAIDDAGARRMARHSGAGDVRRDHRGVDPSRARARADRPGGGAVAAAAAHARRVPLAGRASDGHPAGPGAHRASRPARGPGGAQPDGRGARREVRGGARRLPASRARAGGGDRGPLGVRQVHLRAGARRGVAPHGRLGAARRRGARPVRLRPRAPRRVPAAGGGPVRRHGGGEHRAARPRRGGRRRRRRGEADRSARDDPRPPRRVRLPGVGGRGGAVGGAAPAHRARPRVLRLAGGGGDGRAGLEPGRGRDHGAGARGGGPQAAGGSGGHRRAPARGVRAVRHRLPDGERASGTRDRRSRRGAGALASVPGRRTGDGWPARGRARDRAGPRGATVRDGAGGDRRHACSRGTAAGGGEARGRDHSRRAPGRAGGETSVPGRRRRRDAGAGWLGENRRGAGRSALGARDRRIAAAIARVRGLRPSPDGDEAGPASADAAGSEAADGRRARRDDAS